MTDKEVAEWLMAIKEKYIHGGDEQFDSCRKEALDIAAARMKESNKIRMFVDETGKITPLNQQKKGHWTVLDNCSNAGIYCSECFNKIFDFPSKPKKKMSNYCPNCGSKNEYFINPTTGKIMN